MFLCGLSLHIVAFLKNLKFGDFGEKVSFVNSAKKYFLIILGFNHSERKKWVLWRISKNVFVYSGLDYKFQIRRVL